MPTLVMKFGGNTLGTTSALEQALRIVLEQAENWEHVLLVVSALDGVTDMLLAAAQRARIADQRGYRRIAANLRSRHLALVEQLALEAPASQTLQAEIDQLISALHDNCVAIAQNLHDELLPRESDAVVAIGERLSAQIVAALLRQRGARAAAVDGAEVIITDSAHGNAEPDLAHTARRVDAVLQPLLQRGMIPVVTGFIGATAAGAITTLGRGGSDYSASILSALLSVRELWIWTDVDGMMSADPRQLPDALNIPRLGYQEAADLAYFGARILHARMILPLLERSLPLRIKNVFEPGAPGTLVAPSPAGAPPTLKAVTSVEGLALRRLTGGSLTGVTRLISAALQDTLGARSDVMLVSQSPNSSFLCLVIPTSIGSDGGKRLRRALQAKMTQFPEKLPWALESVALVTAIGNRLNAAPALLADAMRALGDIEIYALALGASHCSLTFALPLQQRRRALLQLHQLIIKSG